MKENHSSRTLYTLEGYEQLNGVILDIFKELQKRILNIDSSVREEYTKLYIAYKSTTNFADIVPQKSKLRISLNMPFGEINDPMNLCKDVSNVGRWGNGDVEVNLASVEEITNVIDLIQQSFDYQTEK